MVKIVKVSFSESADQDDVFGCGAAGEEGWLAVAGEFEPRDLIGGEIGQLFWCAAIEAHRMVVVISPAFRALFHKILFPKPHPFQQILGLRVAAERSIKSLRSRSDILTLAVGFNP